MLFQRRRNAGVVMEEEEEGESDSAQEGEEGLVTSTAPDVVISAGPGSGLKRPLETDEDGRPVIKRRKRRKRRHRRKQSQSMSASSRFHWQMISSQSVC